MMDYREFFFTMSLIWGVTAFVLLVVAWRAVARGNVRLHRSIMLLLTMGAWVFILSYMLRYAFPDDISMHIPPEYIPWIAFHGTVALFPLVGASVLLWARLTGSTTTPLRGHLNRRHKTYGRITASLWLFTHAGGIFNVFLFGLEL